MGAGRFSDTQSNWPMPNAPGLVDGTQDYEICNPGLSDGVNRCTGLEELGEMPGGPDEGD